MANPVQKMPMQPEEFLLWATEQADRYEFSDGEIFAMAGAEDRHVTIAGNAYIALRQHLKGSPCRTFMSDMFVRASVFAAPTERPSASPLDGQFDLVRGAISNL